jgi:carbonic anhydrase
MKTPVSSYTAIDSSTIPRDLTAGLVVFLVALPLCLGIALASGAGAFAGLLSGIIGGILVGALSGSHTSVSGPAAGLTAIVAVQISTLGFPAFLLCVLIAGVIQIVLGIARAGFIASLFPTSVIKGLLAAIGVILILKQIPHLLGRDLDYEGDFAFLQKDKENSFTEIYQSVMNPHLGAATVGLASIALLILWDRIKLLKKSIIPAPLIVVLLGVGLNMLLRTWGGDWLIDPSHLVDVPVATDLSGFLGFLQSPDFTQWLNPSIYAAAITLAIVASLETLLNLEGVDKLDPRQRTSPASRELLAQGIGNVAAGLIGGLPVTSVVVRSSVNINAGGQTKLATIFHGVLLLGCVALLPTYLNLIPLSCLAAILIMTGIKLVSPELIKRMWNAGRYQYIPFFATVLAIVLTDLLIGVTIGLAVSVAFIMNSNLRRPMRRTIEKHLGGEVLRIELANQVSFLNRAALTRLLDSVPRGGQVLLDASNTDYLDPDILELIREFRDEQAPAREIGLSLQGFRKKYLIDDQIQYVEHATFELQSALTPAGVLKILKEGYQRFRTGHRLQRDLSRSVMATATGQHPLAVVLSCIDSRSPAELIFDLGVGDIFSVRIAGNVTSNKVLASIEYATSVAGAKLVLVMGHTKCGAVNAAVQLMGERSIATATGCQHLESIVLDIQRATMLRPGSEQNGKHDTQHLAETLKNVVNPLNGITNHMTLDQQEAYADEVARRNVMRVVREMQSESNTLANLVRAGRIAIVGAMYDITTSEITFLDERENELTSSWRTMEEKLDSESTLPPPPRHSGRDAAAAH